MDPEKFIELQKQMRENNQEVADFLSDFGSWKEQVESKNAHLQNGKPTENKSLPAIRNSLFKKQKKKRGDKLTGSSKPESRRIRSSDYRAWDKFDVDKALEELDESDQRKEGEKNSESSETDEELENQRRLSLAKEARELGNLRFKEGNLQEAIEHYTTSARLTPEDPVPYTNRALAFLKSERYAAAESDCSAALALDSKCVKALFRYVLLVVIVILFYLNVNE
ncbi:RNA polymerase II-associated protein 3 [Fasciola hepatica]|uniref:RNA polymerase II-associated protein 3 n=1 Tax=Fasciola hepatica TaxID=6192 RepID=A0A4E0RVQ8_FASHE|nr:RNA polymerase II-associated protein 3 [Fasciola hepatica]